MKRLILIGGGHSHVEVLRRFGRAPLPDVEIVLMTPERWATYSGMLPGFVAGHYRFEAVHIDLARLARFAGARFEQGMAVGFDPSTGRVLLDGPRHFGFDMVSFDIGLTAATAHVPGAATDAIGLKPTGAFLRGWEEMIERARSHALDRVVVVGGGAAGVEMLLAMQRRLAAMAVNTVAFHLVADTAEVPSSHGPRVAAIFRRILTERGVALHLAQSVERVVPGAVFTSSGERIAGDAIIWAAGGSPPPWLRTTGLALDATGCIAVNEHLQSISHAAVFAAGDCATIMDHPRPKSGVYAVRQGPPLAANLRAALSGRPLGRYVPQARALALISTGDNYAVATRDGWALEGACVWHWKNWIDRRFMARYAVP